MTPPPQPKVPDEAAEAIYERAVREFPDQRPEAARVRSLAGLARLTGDTNENILRAWDYTLPPSQTIVDDFRPTPLATLRERMASFFQATHRDATRRPGGLQAWAERVVPQRDRPGGVLYEVQARHARERFTDAALRREADAAAARTVRRGSRAFQEKVEAMLPIVRHRVARDILPTLERALQYAQEGLTPPRETPWHVRARHAERILGPDHPATQAARDLVRAVDDHQQRIFRLAQEEVENLKRLVNQARKAAAEPPLRLYLPDDAPTLRSRPSITRVFDKTATYHSPEGGYYGDGSMLVLGTPPREFQRLPLAKSVPADYVRNVVEAAERDLRQVRLVGTEELFSDNVPLAIFRRPDGTITTIDARKLAWVRRQWPDATFAQSAQSPLSPLVVRQQDRTVAVIAPVRQDDTDFARALRTAASAVERRQAGQPPVSPTPQSVREATAMNLADVREAVERRQQGGFLRLFGQPATPPPAPPSGPTDMPVEVRHMLDLGRPSLRARLAQQWRDTVQGLRNFFVFEGELLGVRTAPGHTWQELRDDFRLFRDVIRNDIPKRVTDDIVGIVAPLERPEYLTFSDYVVLRDLAEEFVVAARQGRQPSIPLGLTEGMIQQALQAVERRLTPAIREAVARYDRLQAAMQYEFTRRGLGGPDDWRRYHFRHFVLDYLEGPQGATFPRGRLQRPIRPGLRERVGSQKPILTDAITVLQRELSQFYLDNAAEDFYTQIRPKIDWLPALTEQERKALFGPSGKPQQTRQIVVLPDGTKLQTWQYDPGNMVFRGYTLTSRIIEKVTRAAGDVGEQMTVGQLQKGLEEAHPSTTAARESLVIGAKHPMILADPRIVQRLDRFITGRGYERVFQEVTALTSVWKRLLVNFLGLPFQLRNFVGDLTNLFLPAKASARTPLGRALTILIKQAHGTPLTPEEQALLEQAEALRVIRSGFTQSLRRLDVRTDPRLRHLLTPAERLKHLPGEALSAYEGAMNIRENAVRLAGFMDLVARIQRGGAVQISKAIDISGLPPIRAAAKGIREALVDYGAKSPFEDLFTRVGLAPFVTWFYQNTQNYVRLAVREPSVLLRIVPVYAAMVLWNHATPERREIEARLPRWYRMTPHLITGWRLPDGRHLIFSFQDAPTSAAQVLGLTKVYDLAMQVARGEKDVAQAASEALPGIVQEVARGVAQQIGPAVTAPTETLVYALGGPALDIRRGLPRLPERLQHTREGLKQFTVQQLRALFPPLDIALRQMEPSRQVPATTGPLARVGMATGFLRPVDLGTEAQARQREALVGAERAREETLYLVERAYIEGRDWRQVLQARNARGPVRVRPDEAVRRLLEPRVQIERTRQQLRTATDPDEIARLQQRLEALERRQAILRRRRAPRSIRPMVPLPTPPQ